MNTDKFNPKLYRHENAPVVLDYDAPVCICGSLLEIAKIAIDRKDKSNLTLKQATITFDLVCTNRGCPSFQSTESFRFFDPNSHILTKIKKKSRNKK